jgi:hypothetical protein
MDYLGLVNDHLDFVERFYSTAAQPFETKLRKITVGEEPFAPRYLPGEHDGPEYLDEWIEADDGLSVIGQCALGLLEKALHDYLRVFVEREGGLIAEKPWFEKYCRFLEEHTSFRWADSPVSRDRLEQINLSRNDFVHDPTIGSVWPFQSEAHFRKYPTSAFADRLHLAAMSEGGEPDFPVALKVTHENLTAHIRYVRQFCAFVEAQRTKW